MSRILHALKHAFDGIAVLMLTTLFLTFCLQIFARYVLNAPIGWTQELLLTLWLWLILWTTAFCLRSRDHIRFDILYLNMPNAVQRIFFLIAAIAIVFWLAMSFLPTWDYINFYKIKKSATLKIRLNYVFSIYGIFLAVMIMRYLWDIYTHLHPKHWQRIQQQKAQQQGDQS